MIQKTIQFRKARFAQIYDYKYNKYFDFYLNNGSVILGYHSPLLNRAIKNSLSKGFFHYEPSFIEIRAKKKIAKLFSFEVFVYFFYSDFLPESVLAIMQQNNCHQLGANTLRASIPENFDFYIFSSAIANGLPVLALVSKKRLDIQEAFFPLFYYQIIDTVLQEYHKGLFEKKFQSILKGYYQKIEYFSGGRFLFPSVDLDKALCEKLFEKKIYIEPVQDFFYLSLRTRPEQIAYLMKTMKKLGFMQ